MDLPYKLKEHEFTRVVKSNTEDIFQTFTNAVSGKEWLIFSTSDSHVSIVTNDFDTIEEMGKAGETLDEILGNIGGITILPLNPITRKSIGFLTNVFNYDAENPMCRVAAQEILKKLFNYYRCPKCHDPAYEVGKFNCNH